MSTLTIHRIDNRIMTQLRLRAADHERSMEEEALEILRSVLTSEWPTHANLAEAIRGRFAKLGGVQLTSPKRDHIRQGK